MLERRDKHIPFLLVVALAWTWQKSLLCFLPGKSPLLFQEIYDSHLGLPSSLDRLLENQAQRSLKLSFLEKVSSSNTKEAIMISKYLLVIIRKMVCKGTFRKVFCIECVASALQHTLAGSLLLACKTAIWCVARKRQTFLTWKHTSKSLFLFQEKRSKLSNSLNLTTRNERKMVVAPCYPIIRTITSSKINHKSDSA